MSNWQVVRLGALVELAYGASLPEHRRSGEGFPVVGSSGVVGQHRTAAQPGPGIVVGRKGTVGALTWLDTDFSPIDTTYWVRPLRRLNLRWLYHAMQQLGLERLDSSTGVPGLNRGDAYELELHVPPLAEQERIAAVIDAADEARGALTRAIAKHRLVEQALVASVASLSPAGAPPVVVRDLVDHVASGPSPTCEERQIRGDEWGLLKTTAVTWAGWEPSAHKVPPKVFWGAQHLEVREGDVLVTKAGPRHRVAVVAYVDATPRRLMVSGKMVLLRPRTNVVSPRLLAAALSGPDAQRFLDRRTSGMAASQENFANAALLECPLLLPPRPEQERLAGALQAAAAARRALVTENQALGAVRSGVTRDLLAGRVPAGAI